MEIPHEFQTILRRHLPYAGPGDLAPGDDLTALGLDSMGVVQLLVDLEDGYDRELPDDILDEETFATVGSLWARLSALLDAARAGI
uniref:phosphopantetheine-binding protein n=1 Tax=Herbidospora sakaeratensis TaxID=564415 RepID=UPI00078057D2|nr:phosphopantetheine-binding protein [Herbidospora sakaeratensis]